MNKYFLLLSRTGITSLCIISALTNLYSTSLLLPPGFSECYSAAASLRQRTVRDLNIDRRHSATRKPVTIPRISDILPKNVLKPRSEENLSKLQILFSKLYHSDTNNGRAIAAEISHLQEDGLFLLAYALFDPNVHIAIRYRAAYGIGYIWNGKQGRMKDKALKVLLKGLTSKKQTVRNVCRHRLALLRRQKQVQEFIQISQ